jgi:REP element-mobilizing transposase RayT
MALNAFGRIVAEEWHRTGEKRDRVALDAFVVMPNHVHGILWIRPDPANLRQAAPRDDDGSVDRGDAARGGGATDDDGGVGRGDRARGCGAPDDDGGVGRGDAARGGGAPDDDGGVERGDAARGGGTMDDDGSIERSVTARRDASMASADGDDASSTSPHREFGQPRAGSLGTVVGAFKSAVTRRINQHRGTPGASVWQRNYHDRIIRNERHLHAARRYIRDNPAKWHEDRAHRGG